MLLCDQRTISTLPQPLQCFAKGLRALPPLQHVGEHPLDIHSVGWHAPLWSNPLFVVRQQDAAVALEHVVPVSLLNLQYVQCLGQLIVLRHELQRVCASNSLAAHASYNISLWPTYLQRRPAFADRREALRQVQALIALLPAPWVEAAENHFHQAHQPVTVLMSVSQSDIQASRQLMCVNLGWPTALLPPNLTRPLTFAALTVAAATRLQHSPTKLAIAKRHADVGRMIAELHDHPPQQLPAITTVLHRWWQLKVSNDYKEAAWKLTLNAFPTAKRMNNSNPCVACGHTGPDLQHHFWLCPVAEAVRREIEHQLHAFRILPAQHVLHCASIWLAHLPSPRLHRVVWDLVCLAAIYAMEIGRRTSWAVAQKVTVSSLVNVIASKAAVAAFWDALADFAVTCKIRPAHRNALLPNHPFITWCTVLLDGNGLRVMRR